MPTGTYGSRDSTYTLVELAGMLAGNRKSPEYQQYLSDLTQYYINEHPNKVRGKILIGPGVCTVTLVEARVYCVEHDIPIPGDLPGPETPEEKITVMLRSMAASVDRSRVENQEHLEDRGKAGNRASDVMALICLALETLGINATRDEVVRFLLPVVGHRYSPLVERKPKGGFGVEKIKEDGGAIKKTLTLAQLSKKISDIRAEARADVNYVTDRAERVSKVLRGILLA